MACAACAGDDGKAEFVVQAGHAGDVNRLVVEEFLSAGNARACTVYCGSRRLQVRPGPKQTKYHRRKPIVEGIETKIRSINHRVQRIDGIVDSDIEPLCGEGNGPSNGSLRIKTSSFEVKRLSCEQSEFEVHDLPLLCRSGRYLRLRMAHSRVHGLVREVRNQDGTRVLRFECDLLRSSLRRRLAAIPHDRAHKSQICGGQRTPIHRKRIGFAAAVRIVDILDDKLCIRWNRYRNPNQSPAGQQTVCMLSSFESRDFDVVVTVGSVVRPEDRIQTSCRYESFLNTARGNRPTFLRTMTGTTASTVRTETLEKGP